MRVDKYLKNARLIKRRTIAKEACDQGRISINEKTAKPGTEVKIGDIIEMTYANRKLKIRILSLDEHVTKEMSKLLYEVVSEERL